MPARSMRFRMIGAVGRDSPIPPDALRALLSNPVRLNTGDEFRGRIATKLYVNDRYALKLKTDFALQEPIAQSWVERQLAREREWDIYHPERSWGIVIRNGLAAIFNVTPRLQTLNTLLAWDEGGDESLDLLGQVLASYFRLYHSHRQCQDLSPSNYGVADGRAWYLDDDVYGDDSLVSFAHAMGNLFRQFAGWPAATWQKLGERLRQILGTHAPDMLAVAEHQLRQVLLLGEAARARDALVRAFETPGAPARKLPLEQRFAVLADIHGNLPALQAVYDWLDACGIDTVLVLGDIVGYGPWPGECIDLLRERRALCIRGNHDHAAATGVCGPGYSRAARWSAPWTLERLSAEQRAWLGELPPILTARGWMAVHGSAVDPEFFYGYVYGGTAERNLDWLQEHKVQVCLHGHSHIPGIWYRERITAEGFRCEPRMRLDAGGHYLVCPGSVGQPRNGGREAQFMVVDPVKGIVEFHQLPYVREELVSAVAEHEFPDMVAGLFR